MMRGKLWFALLIAPLSEIAVVAVTVLVLAVTDANGLWSLGEILGATAAYATFAVPLAYLGALVVGVPVHWILRAINFSEVRYYFLIGVIVGIIIGGVPGEKPDALWLSLATLSSATVATVFGVLVTAKKPDAVAI